MKKVKSREIKEMKKVLQTSWKTRSAVWTVRMIVPSLALGFWFAGTSGFAAERLWKV